MRLRSIFLISFVISFFLTPLISRLSLKLGIVDLPGERKMHAHPTPILGGLAIFIATAFPLVLRMNLSGQTLGVVLAGSLIIASSLINDIKAISARIRFLIEVIASLILVYHGIRFELFADSSPLFFLNYILTIAWVVGVINAVNYLDGLNGLLTMLSLVMLASFAYIGYISNQFLLLTVIASLAGALLGFLRYNFPEARIFLGDTGSKFIGFSLAVISLVGSWAQDSIVKLFVPVFILGVPILDMGFTTLMRIRENKVKTVKELLEYAGKDHIHHRLLSIGLNARQAVYFICVMSLSLGISGIILYNSERTDVWFSLIQAFCVFFIISIVMVLGEKTAKNV